MKLLPPNAAERIWGVIGAVLLALALALVLWLIEPRQARAEPVTVDCADLATGMSLMVDFRDTGADVEKVVRLIKQRNSDSPPAHRAVIEREIRRIWTEGKPRRDAVQSVYKRCRDQLGDMGRDS